MSGKTPVYTVSGETLKDVSAVTSAWPTLDALDITKSGFRLPTEAEWEVVARGGDPSNTTNWAYTFAGAGSSTSDTDALATVAWYNGNAENAAHPVGGKTANSAGLFDMSGNVWEWCWDWYSSISTSETVSNPSGAASGSYRVLRGGSWGGNASGYAVSFRNYGHPVSWDNSLGFRVVCP